MQPRTPAIPRRRAHVVASISVAAALVAVALAAPAGAAPPPSIDPRNPDFGPNVSIFSPATPLDQIQSTLDTLAAQQRDAEMSSARHAVYFLPGQYGIEGDPLQFQVGYYTEVAGLGANPGDVNIRGAAEVYNRCLGDGGTSNCIALNNFWRTLANLTVQVDKAGQDGCRQTANFWAVSQAVSLRRVQFTGGTNLSLMDYCTAGPQYASGGYIADSKLPFTINGSQQQWLTRNSEVAGWSNGVWNQVFSGVVGAPSDATFPNPPYTTVDKTPVSREKPYLYVGADGRYAVRVPAAHTDTVGTSWGDTSGRSIPITDFYIAKPGDSVQVINNNLARGKNLLLTPGVYDIAGTIEIKRPDTVVLGMGHATLTAVGGAVPVEVKDVSGVVVAGVTIDAGTKLSPALMRIGKPNGAAVKSDAANPVTLNDVYFRVGGPHVGRATTALEVNSDNVLIDHIWVWRADHGIEGFSGDTERWNTNTGTTGVIVNGDDVTATGLFVEHFQTYNTVWNGERGRVILYQNELPYDPPTQADWTQPDGTLGYPGYFVADGVKTHELDGGGVYVFNQNDPSIVTENGFVVPEAPGVRLHHIMTVNLAAGTILHVVNGIGGTADTSKIGIPQYIADYPV